MANLLSLPIVELNLVNLPVDILHFYIFDYLDLDDVFKLKLVSKKFRLIVQSYDINELSFYNVKSSCNEKYYEYKGYWRSMNKSTKLRNQLDSSKLPMLTNALDNLTNLKYLRIKDFKCIKIKDLNKFMKLHVIELDDIKMSSKDILKLPDLKILSIKFLNHISFRGKKLTIDTPNLHSLYIYQHNDYRHKIDRLIKIKHPHSIRYLKMRWYESIEPTFVNLETLELITDNLLDINDLTKYKNLKTLKVINMEKEDDLKYLFIMLDDLDVFLCGVRLKELDKFDEYQLYDKANSLAFQLDNYEELEYNMDFIKKADYKSILRLSNQPNDVFRKYANIQLILIRHVTSEESDLFINFMKACPNLCNLEVRKSSLDEKFFNQLPEFCSISNLIIKYQEGFGFKFIAKMPYLVRLQTDEEVLIDEDLNLNNLKYLREIRFRSGMIKIVKEGKDKYFLKTPDMIEDALIDLKTKKFDYEEDSDYEDFENFEDFETLNYVEPVAYSFHKVIEYLKSSREMYYNHRTE